MRLSDSIPTADRTVLVSFCNQPMGAPGVALVAVNSQRLDVRATGLKYSETDIRQVTGLTSIEGNIFAAVRRGRSFCILRLGAHLTIEDTYELRSVRAVHSLVATGPEDFHVVSTGTDEVVRVRIDATAGRVISEEAIWQPDPDGESEDVHHLNGLTHGNGQLIISGFGKHWRDVRALRKQGNAEAPYHGFLVNITTGQRLLSGLQMPHSPLALDQGIAVCNSASETVIVPDNRVLEGLPGYTRGLCKVGELLLVGISCTRINNPGRQTGSCSIMSFDRRDLTSCAEIKLDRYASEIYDILPIG